MAVVAQGPSSPAVSEEQHQHQVVGLPCLTVVDGLLLLASPWLHMASVGLPSLASAAQPVAPVLVACETSTDLADLEPLTSATSAPVGAASGQSWPGYAVSAGLGEDCEAEDSEQ